MNEDLSAYVLALKTEVNYSNVTEFETHLRIAWKQDGSIRYDLYNDKWDSTRVAP